MQRVILLIMMLVGNYFSCIGQELITGVFLTATPTTSEDKLLKTVSTFDNKKVYIPPVPIIATQDFSEVTQMKSDASKGEAFFYLLFSKESSSKLKRLIKEVPGIEIVLVVENKAVAYIRQEGELNNTAVRVFDAINSTDILGVQMKLKNIIKQQEE